MSVNLVWTECPIAGKIHQTCQAQIVISANCSCTTYEYRIIWCTAAMRTCRPARRLALINTCQLTHKLCSHHTCVQHNALGSCNNYHAQSVIALKINYSRILHTHAQTYIHFVRFYRIRSIRPKRSTVTTTTGARQKMHFEYTCLSGVSLCVWYIKAFLLAAAAAVASRALQR